MKETFTTSEGLTLDYERRGSGPPLVCHPGGPGFSSRLFDEAAGLDEQLELVLLDPRGTGGSSRPAGREDYEVADYVADLEALREHLALDAIDLLGWSHGGIVAMAYAAAYRQRVRRLILVGTLARFAPEQEQAMEAAIAARAVEPWYADAKQALEAELAGDFATDEELGALAFREFPFYFAQFGERERAYLERVRETPNADALHLFNMEIVASLDLRPELGLIEAPALVLAGEDDFIAGPASARELTDALGDVRTVTIPACGHFLFLESPERVRAAINEFLS